MTTAPNDQVELSTLLFGMSWEDPESDRRALSIRPGETLLTISSGACNTLTLLLEDPGVVHAVDINPSQSYLLELKCAAVRRLDYEDLRAFLGVVPSDRRVQTFDRIKGDLSDDARRFWTARAAAIRAGVIHQGRYESFIGKFGKVLGVLQGRRRIEGMFASTTVDAQRRYFDERWNTFVWRTIFALAFNKRMLAKRGLTADYFKFDDGSSSFAESFFRRSRRAMSEIPIQSNYFLAQYIRGSYLSEEAVPAYLRRENLDRVRDRLDRIEIVTSDAQGWLARQSAGSIDAYSLSNICELMSTEETGRLFTEVARTARPGARICFRNLMVPRDVPAHLRSSIRRDEPLSQELAAQDRSFVYSRVGAYTVPANEAVRLA
jgi:S-adenosylmethionine-diacylglycerol 3-amino-3-carboxypropyl transferase